jgi:serine/threonine-protein kinase RsbT
MNCESLVVDDVQLPITSDLDLVRAREQGRVLAGQLGFQQSDLTLVATAISELARNIVRYARRGEIVLRQAEDGGIPGIVIIARDEGPGIPDVNRAMEQGYSTSGGLGLGLPGVRRIMDEFQIVSEVGKGTVVTVVKWKR